MPEPYRRFLLEVGDGGAGPYYGLTRLGQTPEFPAGPFLHASAWNPNAVRPEMSEDEYFDARWVAGSMVICEFGCGAYCRLVLTGPARGGVWLDGRSSDGGIVPLADFRAWYLDWIAKIAKRFGVVGEAGEP